MNDEQTAVLREIRDLLREQNTLAKEVRDMNQQSMQWLQASREQSEQLMARSDNLQLQSDRADSRRPFPLSTLVLYGAAIVLALALFSQLRAFW